MQDNSEDKEEKIFCFMFHKFKNLSFYEKNKSG